MSRTSKRLEAAANAVILAALAATGVVILFAWWLR